MNCDVSAHWLGEAGGDAISLLTELTRGLARNYKQVAPTE